MTTDSDGGIDAVSLYAKQRSAYVSYADRLRDLLASLMAAHGLAVHVIEARAKTVDSFREKIARPGKAYTSPLDEVDDLCGCRVITYYADDVQRVAEIVKREFAVLSEELSHQQNAFDADRFGYLSAHYVVRLNEARGGLAEWASYAAFRSEIQIRTVIQHAWSAVSHALQYKQETSIPSALQRRLFRIAGLFELADEEFVGIRDQKSVLQRDAQQAVAEGRDDVPLTLSTIREAVASWKDLRKVRAYAKRAGLNVLAELSPEDARSETITDIHDLATAAGLHDVNALLADIATPRLAYLKELSRRTEPTYNWQFGDDFLFFFLLLDKHRDIATLPFLLGHHWHEGYARWLLDQPKPEPG